MSYTASNLHYNVIQKWKTKRTLEENNKNTFESENKKIFCFQI